MTQKKKIKKYCVGLDSEAYAISLVEYPAIESDFIYLSAEKPIEVKFSSDEKHLILGAVLIPDFPIYRNQGGEEFYVQFTKESIEKMAHNYLMSDNIYSFTKHHTDIADGIAVVESWIKTDENDKSNAFGFDLPIGTWFVASKVENDEIWDKVKSGEFRGYSIEAFVELNELNLHSMTDKNNIEMDAIQINDGFWDKLRQIISDALGKPQESEEVEKTVGEIVDEMEVQAENPDKDKEIVEAEETEKPMDVVVDETIKDVVEEVEQTADNPQEAKEDYEAIIAGLKEEIVKKDAEIEQLKRENQKLSKTPSTDPVKAELKKNDNPRDIIEKLYNGTYFQK